jgi:hypothetical protein
MPLLVGSTNVIWNYAAMFIALMCGIGCVLGWAVFMVVVLTRPKGTERRKGLLTAAVTGVLLLGVWGWLAL